MTPSRNNPGDHPMRPAIPERGATSDRGEYVELAQGRRLPSVTPARRSGGSISWLAPAGTRRRLALDWTTRLGQLLAREGALALARRKILQAAGRLAERSMIWGLMRRPWQCDGRPIFLMISHRCGGGTERHVGELSAALLREGIRPLHVRPSCAGRMLWEERDLGGRSIWCRESTTERDSIEHLLYLVRPVHAHVHHMMGLPDSLLDLLNESGVPYDWTIHDYSTICPRVNLIGATGIYCGEPDAESCNRCLAELGDDQGRPVSCSITAWRDHFARRLQGARRVFAPSPDACRRLARHFPGLSVWLRPHAEALPCLEGPAAAPRAGETVKVAVLGTIVPVKGALRLLACARDALDRRLPLAFHIIGSTDRNAVFRRLSNVRITGRYREHEVYERLAQERCHLAFLPSLWPETFLYTLSIAMAARLFVLCFDSGAQAERVRASGWGRLLPLEASPSSINDSLLSAAASLLYGPAAPLPPRSASYPKILSSYYDFSPIEEHELRGSPSRGTEKSRPDLYIGQSRDHARIY
jgi:glycosyltransferase involved in cell wall biosynthesis